MPGQTLTLSDYLFETIELASEACERRGRLRKARLLEEYGADYGVAQLRETLIADCPKFGTPASRLLLSLFALGVLSFAPTTILRT
jgi:hypothetical protein